MKLSDQVCSIENAIKLKDIGVKQDSLFFWFIPLLKLEPLTYLDPQIIYPGEEIANWDKTYSAFTASELGSLLPDKIMMSKVFNPLHWGQLEIKKVLDKWWISYSEIYNDLPEFNNNNLADGMAEMLIYLTENKIKAL